MKRLAVAIGLCLGLFLGGGIVNDAHALRVCYNKLTSKKRGLWIGTAPFCKGSPSDCLKHGGVYEGRDRYGRDSRGRRQKKCVTGYKVFCKVPIKRRTCERLDKRYDYYWFGTAPFCGGDADDCKRWGGEFLGTDSRGDGKRCKSGVKAFCRCLAGKCSRNPPDTSLVARGIRSAKKQVVGTAKAIAKVSKMTLKQAIKTVKDPSLKNAFDTLVMTVKLPTNIVNEMPAGIAKEAAIFLKNPMLAKIRLANKAFKEVTGIDAKETAKREGEKLAKKMYEGPIKTNLSKLMRPFNKRGLGQLAKSFLPGVRISRAELQWILWRYAGHYPMSQPRSKRCELAPGGEDALKWSLGLIKDLPGLLGGWKKARKTFPKKLNMSNLWRLNKALAKYKKTKGEINSATPAKLRELRKEQLREIIKWAVIEASIQPFVACASKLRNTTQFRLCLKDKFGDGMRDLLFTLVWEIKIKPTLDKKFFDKWSIKIAAKLSTVIAAKTGGTGALSFPALYMVSSMALNYIADKLVVDKLKDIIYVPFSKVIGVHGLCHKIAKVIFLTGASKTLPPGTFIALYNKTHQRFVRMNSRQAIDRSVKRSSSNLPRGWKWERFKVVSARGGQVALYNTTHRRFLKMDSRGRIGVSASTRSRTPRAEESFQVIDAGAGEVGLYNTSSRRFLRMSPKGVDASNTTKSKLPSGWKWERFVIGK